MTTKDRLNELALEVESDAAAYFADKVAPCEDWVAIQAKWKAHALIKRIEQEADVAAYLPIGVTEDNKEMVRKLIALPLVEGDTE